MVSVEQIIGKINPSMYAENSAELLKDYKNIKEIPAEKVKPTAIRFNESLGKASFHPDGPEASHKLIYESPADAFEAIYFWILDFMEQIGLKVEKLVDNFSSTATSGFTGDMTQRRNMMQQQATQAMGQINTILRSVLNLLYDLRDFKSRLESYDSLKSSNPKEKEGAKLALKQIWIDKVDMQRGNSSIAMMARQLGFQTLFDAFYSSNNEEDAEKLDLNERVKRIVKQRIHEFNIWIAMSEKELRKRFEIEKNYLKSQINSLRLYAKWAKPYLQAATELEGENAGNHAGLVKAFNTIVFQLTLIGKKQIKLPPELKGITNKRNYYGCVLVDIKFRGLPQRTQAGGFSYAGKTDATFKAYALNDDELKMLNKELEKKELEEMFNLIEGATGESIQKIIEDVEEFLEDDKPEEESKKKQTTKNFLAEAFEPFTALFGYDSNTESKPKQKKENKKEKSIPPDNWIEETHLRSEAVNIARERTYFVFDIYKKAHGMKSYLA